MGFFFKNTYGKIINILYNYKKLYVETLFNIPIIITIIYKK